ncbi:autophagy-related protein 22-like protein [Gilbertella persicaria]|uniref:autophagy-related protein 22-like protein n=1 Tax=Gilbertella persicaria TaxID=101096 RepID=UPI00221E5AF9|nr:autophagy-related protein 22-like protein [Gilbertella persicaria]KAI8047442.1 autophagy-related protein 22-like protein [Gilbertella persicaria]
MLDGLFASPFNHSDDEIDSSTDKGKAVLSQPPASKWELWGYYLYYNGDNGYTINSYLPNILQYLAYRGGFYPETPNVRGCDLQDADRNCYVPWAGTSGIPVSAMTLYTQAISFSIQFVLFTTFGSLADYGRWNTYILLLTTIVGCVTQIVPIAFFDDDGSKWNSMLAVYILALISYGTSLVFYAAAFPTLSDNLPIVRKARADPDLDRDEAAYIAEKWRNHVSAISTVFSNVGFLIMTALLSGISFISWTNYDFPSGVDHVLGNVPLFNFISTAVCGVFWVINAVPYFLAVPRGRRGPSLPEGSNHFTIGWKSVFIAIREARKLRYLFLYIFAYFMFADAVSTMNQMIAITQSQITGFSAQQITILNLASAVTSILGCLLFLWISKQFGVRTKTNLMLIILLTGVVPVWGCFGIGLRNFGIRTTWELWVFYVWSGLFTAPIWAWQNTMLAELVPRGKENLFFGLFGVINKGSSWIGPVVIGAITQYTDNLWKGWPFVLGLFVLSLIIIWFIDVDKAKIDITNYLAEQDILDGHSDGNELIIADDEKEPF